MTMPDNSSDPIEQLYIESSAIGLVEFRRRIQALSIQERIDEVELLRMKQYTAPDPIKPRSQKIRAVSVFDIDTRIIELTALKDKQEKKR